MVAKGIFLIIIIDMSMESDPPAIWIVPLMFLLINILPNIVLAVIGIASNTGFNKALTSKIMEYPAFLALPVFTNFAVGQKYFYQMYLSKCCRDSQDNPPELQLVVSGSLTAMNTGLTTLGYGITYAMLVVAKLRDDKLKKYLDYII